MRMLKKIAEVASDAVRKPEMKAMPVKVMKEVFLSMVEKRLWGLRTRRGASCSWSSGGVGVGGGELRRASVLWAIGGSGHHSTAVDDVLLCNAGAARSLP